MTTQPKLPPHDPSPWSQVPAETLAKWPLGSFLENLVIAEDGSIYCSVHPTGEVFRLTPNNFTPVRFGATAGTAAGLVLAGDGRLFVMSGYPDHAPASVWVLSPGGEARLWAEIPEASFLNGATPFGTDGLLVVDSLNGSIFRVGTDQPLVSLWFRDDRLTQRPDTPLFPGANGIKRRGDRIIVSNTDRAQIYAIAIRSDGSAGEAELIADRLLFDDFAVGDDGALYGCAHAYNELVRLGANGVRTVLAGPAQGIVNPTACAFGRRPEDRHALYVTSTGGVAAPLPGGLEPARLVRLDL